MAKRTTRSAKTANVDDKSTTTDAATKPITKSAAVRETIAKGYTSPQEGVAYIKAEYGLELTPQHFSAIKAQTKAKSGIKGRRGRKPSGTVEGYLAPPTRGVRGGAELLEAMEVMKPLVATLGADKLKRIVDLLG